MKTNQVFKLRKFILLSIIYLFSTESSFSTNLIFMKKPVFFNVSKLTVRGLEIRYIVITDKKDLEKKEIEVDGKKYALYKSKEEAIREVTMEKPKRDYKIVYVISDKKKDLEIIELVD